MQSSSSAPARICSITIVAAHRPGSTTVKSTTIEERRKKRGTGWFRLQSFSSSSFFLSFFFEELDPEKLIAYSSQANNTSRH